MAIQIESLINAERRNCTLELTYEEGGEVRQEEIRVSFLKPTEALWRKIITIEETAGPDVSVRVEQLLVTDIQSPDILDEDGSVHRITRDDLLALNAMQISEL